MSVRPSAQQKVALDGFVPAVIRDGGMGAPIAIRLPNGLAIEADSRVVSPEWLASLLAEISV